MSDLVTVLLPCFDAEPFLGDALDSVLGQTYPHLEVLAVDDGSRDGTLELLRSYEARDPRVRVVVNDENLGLIATLNRGLELARGALVARMDADDVCHPERIERQVAFLHRRSDVDVVGTGAVRIDARGERLRRLPARATEPEAVAFLALLATPLVHGSLVARAEPLRRWRYRREQDALHAEDYDLLARMLAAGVRIANLAEPLYRLRGTDTSVSHRHEQVQIAHFTALAGEHLAKSLGVRFDPAVHRVLVNRLDGSVGARDLARGLRAVERVRRRFLRERSVPAAARAEIDAVAHQQRWDVLIQALLKGTPVQRASAAFLLPAGLPGLRLAGVRDYLAAKLGGHGPAGPAGPADPGGAEGEAR